ncbi:THAP domain-containing protein 2, partial [Danaus plexippus plexippus]
FPKCPEIKDKWIDACQNEDALWRPSKDSVVCSRHFTDDCYRQLKRPRRLRMRSVPTLNLPKKIIWEGSLRDMVITDYLKEQREKKQLLQLLEKKIVTEKRSDRRKSYDRKRNRKVKQSTIHEDAKRRK